MGALEEDGISWGGKEGGGVDQRGRWSTRMVDPMEACYPPPKNPQCPDCAHIYLNVSGGVVDKRLRSGRTTALGSLIAWTGAMRLILSATIDVPI